LNGDGVLDKWEEMYNVSLLEEEDNDIDNDGDESSWEEMYDVSLKEETINQYETLIETGDAFGSKPVLSFY